MLTLDGAGDDAKVFGGLLNKILQASRSKLDRFHLKNMKIGDKGVALVAEQLENLGTRPVPSTLTISHSGCGGGSISALLSALKGRSDKIGKGIRELDLSGTRISQKMVGALQKRLCNDFLELKVLRLRECTGKKALVESLILAIEATAGKLVELDLSRVPMSSSLGLLLARALNKVPVKTLRVAGCGLKAPEICAMLATLFHSHRRRGVTAGNREGDNGVPIPTYYRIDISNNNIGSEGGIEVASLIDYISVIKEFRINGCNLGYEGTAYIAHALGSSPLAQTSLEIADLSANVAAGDFMQSGKYSLSIELGNLASRVKTLVVAGDPKDGFQFPLDEIIKRSTKSKTLRELDISGNRLGLDSQGVELLRNLILRSHKLETLRLDRNEFREFHMPKLFHAIGQKKNFFKCPAPEKDFETLLSGCKDPETVKEITNLSKHWSECLWKNRVGHYMK